MEPLCPLRVWYRYCESVPEPCMIPDLGFEEVMETTSGIAGILDLRTLGTDQDIAFGETIAGW
jgi:hypothetical protein